MRIHIDGDSCQGHGVCHMEAPELFHLRAEDGRSYVDAEEVPAGLEEAARRGADTCPERAIAIDE